MLKTNLKLYPEGDVIRIGLNASTKKRLGKIILIEMPEVGEWLSLGFIFGLVVAMDHSLELRMPVDGKIVAVNNLLEETPELIKDGSADMNWIIKIKGRTSKTKKHSFRLAEEFMQN